MYDVSILSFNYFQKSDQNTFNVYNGMQINRGVYVDVDAFIYIFDFDAYISLVRSICLVLHFIQSLYNDLTV